MVRIRVGLLLLPFLLVAHPTSAQTIRYVVDYGALCDGASNDFSAIQDAFDALQPGDRLVFPAGSCVYDPPENAFLRIQDKGSDSMETFVEGAGQNETFLVAANPNRSAIKISGSTWLKVQDLQVRSPNATVRTGDDGGGFFVSLSARINFERVTVWRTAGAGMSFWGVTDTGVYHSSLLETFSDGIHIQPWEGSVANVGMTIAHNYAYATGDDSFATTGTGVANRYIGFFNNTSEYSQTSGITVEASQNVEVWHNTIRHSGQDQSRSAASIRVIGHRGWDQEVGTDEVDVYQNDIYDSNSSGSPRQNRGDGAINVSGWDGLAATRVHIRENRIFSPNVTTAAINIFGFGGGYAWWIDVIGNYMPDGHVPLMWAGGDAYSIYFKGNSAPWLYIVTAPVTWR